MESIKKIYAKTRAQVKQNSSPPPQKVLGRYSKSPRSLFYAYLAFLFWLPIPLGSNRPWAWSMMEVWIFAIAMVWLALYTFSNLNVTTAFRCARTVILCWSIWLLFSTLHFLPLPVEITTFLAPKLAAIHQTATPGEGLSAIPLSITPYASWVEWLKGASYLLVFIMTLLLVESRNRLRMLAWIMVSSAAIQAMIGTFFFLSESHMELLFSAVSSPQGAASGTFINRNHFANFLVINFAMGIGLIIAGLKESSQTESFDNKLLSFIRVIISYKLPLRIFLVIIVIGIVLSRSRMGNTSLLISLFIAGTFILKAFKARRHIVILLLLSFLVVDLFLIGKVVGVDKVLQRIEQTTVATESKPKVFKDTLSLIGDHWLLGTGMGSFSDTFPRYKSFTAENHFRHAENDYLEYFAETGLIGFSLLGFPVLLSLLTVIRIHLQTSDPLYRGLSFASIMGISATLIHALADFNLHIPANTVTFMVLLSIPWMLKTQAIEQVSDST
ncbi:MAG: O-antigen ligase family protein [Magnetococcales bacterium]|nr:O-antigen ligase family protein [Magnetococcales bacterium]